MYFHFRTNFLTNKIIFTFICTKIKRKEAKKICYFVVVRFGPKNKRKVQIYKDQ